MLFPYWNIIVYEGSVKLYYLYSSKNYFLSNKLRSILPTEMTGGHLSFGEYGELEKFSLIKLRER